MIQEAVRTFGQKTFSSLSVRNYRLYFTGQAISQAGSWMQIVAMGWLVLQLTGSGVALGMLLGLRFVPVLVLGPLGGALVDRFDKRITVFVVQAAFALTAFVLGVLVFADVVQMWMLYALAVVSGCIDVIDRPARQTFIHEMVGPEHLRNAVTLNSTMVNLARAVGPLIAGILIAAFGTAACFLANAISFLAVLVVLAMMRVGELHREEAVKRPLGLDTIVEGFQYAFQHPLIWNVLIAMTIVGTLSYEFQASLPLFAKDTFGGDVSDYAALTSAFGVGSVAGGLFAAGRARVAAREFVLYMILFGISMCVAGVMPTLPYAVVALTFVGFFSINLTSVGNTMVQLASSAHMRGRVMALWSMAIFGSTVIGAPVIGIAGQYLGARWSLLIGGIAAVLAGVLAVGRMLEWDIMRLIPESIGLASEEVEAEESAKI
jgi:MFS family permease